VEEQLVIFELGNENYGLDISTVEGIIKIQEITKMPRAPEFVEGVTNLRGMVVPVLDLRKRFGLPIFDNTRETRIVIVNIGKTKVGMIVDGVSEVLRVQEDAIEPTPPMISSVSTAFIRGIAKVNNKLVTLLDLSKVLNLSEITAVSKIAA
jgi:purine-binding chemotaxis protein CheW